MRPARDVRRLRRDEFANYVGSTMRFVPVEVITRYYQQPIAVPWEPKAPPGYPVIHQGARNLGEQAYEHEFEAAVLFSDVSGFTKLTNQAEASVAAGG